MTRISQGRASDQATNDGADKPSLHESLPIALYETLWPILADERGDVLSIKSASVDFKDGWLKLKRPLDEPAFNQAVALWEGWTVGFGKVVESLEGCLRAVRLIDKYPDMAPDMVPDIRRDVLLFLGPLLIDAMLAEVPKLANLARKQGRPTEHSRNYVIDQVFDGLAALLGTYPGYSRTLYGSSVDSETLDGSSVDSDKAGREPDYFNYKDECIELLFWLLPSLERKADRTRKDMFGKASSRMALDTWLTEAEQAVLNELESEHDGVATTAVTCSVCDLEAVFPGGVIKANEAAREAGWLIDTHKTSNNRYRCPECKGQPESQRGRVPPRPGKNHSWR